MKNLALILMVIAFCFSVHAQKQKLQRTIYKSPFIDSIELNSIVSLNVTNYGCFDQMQYLIRLKKTTAGYLATFRDFGEVWAETKTTKIDRTYPWGKLSKMQIDQIRDFERNLIFLAKNPDTLACSQKIYRITDTSHNKTVETKICESESFDRLRRSLFPTSVF